jgi:hypothetical protein
MEELLAAESPSFTTELPSLVPRWWLLQITWKSYLRLDYHPSRLN